VALIQCKNTVSISTQSVEENNHYNKPVTAQVASEIRQFKAKNVSIQVVVIIFQRKNGGFMK